MGPEWLKPEFPYLSVSILNAKEFYDHHFLFHVALIPFTFGDLLFGAKLAAVTFSAFAFVAVGGIIFSRRKRNIEWLLRRVAKDN